MFLVLYETKLIDGVTKKREQKLFICRAVSYILCYYYGKYIVDVCMYNVYILYCTM